MGGPSVPSFFSFLFVFVLRLLCVAFVAVRVVGPFGFASWCLLVVSSRGDRAKVLSGGDRAR